MNHFLSFQLQVIRNYSKKLEMLLSTHLAYLDLSSDGIEFGSSCGPFSVAVDDSGHGSSDESSLSQSCAQNARVQDGHTHCQTSVY